MRVRLVWQRKRWQTSYESLILIVCPSVFRTFDKDHDGFVNMREWIEGLSVILRGTLDEKIKCKLTPLQCLSLNTNLKRYKQSKLQTINIQQFFPFLRGSDCFCVYDLNSDNYISREEMFQMLKNCLIRQPAEEDPEEGVRDLVEIALKMMVSRWLQLKCHVSLE